MMPPEFPFTRRIVRREPEPGDVHGAEAITLECGHEVISIIPWRGDKMPCAQCLQDELDKLKKKSAGRM